MRSNRNTTYFIKFYLTTSLENAKDKIGMNTHTHSKTNEFKYNPTMEETNRLDRRPIRPTDQWTYKKRKSPDFNRKTGFING